MINLDLKTSTKAVKDYYVGLEEFAKLGVSHETAVRSAFQRLLEHCCRRTGWTLIGEYKYVRKGKRPLSIDGAAVDTFKIPQAYWEAKDTQDDLPTEVRKKFEKGYPKNNILFQSPDRAILWQNSRQILDEDITKPDTLVYVVKELFAYRSETQRDWEVAVEEFKPHIPDIAAKVVELIEIERKENKSFVQAFNAFAEVCRSSINPNLSDAAVEEMPKDKTAIIYNDFLTLAGIPPEAFAYRLGNRSTLEWIIDRYQVHRDKRSGIVNDPNRADDPRYIVKLIGKVVTVSLETVEIVKSLPDI